MIRALLIVVLLALAGCGTSRAPSRVSETDIRHEDALQRRLALETELGRRQRLLDVVYRLAVAAAPDCGGGRPLAGFEMGSLGLVPRDYAEVAAMVGLGSEVRVLAVANSSPAWSAGLRAGDVIEAIAGQPVRPGFHAYRDAGFELGQRLADGPVALAVRRGDQAFEMTLQAQPGCVSDVFITREAMPTPKANGKAVLLPVSFMRQARREDELAAIVAFLMAYNVRGHADVGLGMPLTSRRDLSALFGEDETNLFQPPRPLDRAGVLEADAYAIELARRAGYDPARVIYFWRRYLVSTPELAADIGWGKELARPARLARMQTLLDSPAPQ